MRALAHIIVLYSLSYIQYLEKAVLEVLYKNQRRKLGSLFVYTLIVKSKDSTLENFLKSLKVSLLV